MRKFEISVPEELLPEVSRAVHGYDLKFIVEPSNIEEEVIISIPYEKEQEDDIESLETEIGELTNDYNEQEDEDEDEKD